MAKRSLKAAVKHQHCSLRLTVCAGRKERERPRNKQNMPNRSYKSGKAHLMLFVLLRPFVPMWLCQAPVSLNPLNPPNPLWLLNLNPNPILTARERREPLPHNRNHRLKKPRKGSNPRNLEHSPRRGWQK